MFVIVYNNNVILGPMRWNRFRFENEIKEECDITVSLNDRNDDFIPVFLSDEIKILPIQGTETPTFNSKIEFLNGPYWEFTDTVALMSYRVEQLPIDSVKNMLKEQVAAERWKKENSGVLITLNNIEYKFASDRDTRNILQNTLQSGINQINWKIDRENWITLTVEDIQFILNSIISHVQQSFDWEYAKNGEIDAKTDLVSLDAIIISEKQLDI